MQEFKHALGNPEQPYGGAPLLPRVGFRSGGPTAGLGRLQIDAIAFTSGSRLASSLPGPRWSFPLCLFVYLLAFLAPACTHSEPLTQHSPVSWLLFRGIFGLLHTAFLQTWCPGSRQRVRGCSQLPQGFLCRGEEFGHHSTGLEEPREGFRLHVVGH